MKLYLMCIYIVSTMAILSACNKKDLTEPFPSDRSDLIEQEKIKYTDTTVQGIPVYYSYGFANMKLTLPDGWDYRIQEHSTSVIEIDNGIPVERSNPFGIEFWLINQPEVKFQLLYQDDSFGICGTGVTFSDITFENGMQATQCTEKSTDHTWILFIFKDTPGTYTLESTLQKKLWNDNKQDIMEILETVELAEGILRESKAIEIGKTQCTIDYGMVLTSFDFETGCWSIHFYKENTAGGDQIILVDDNGNIVESIYGE